MIEHEIADYYIHEAMKKAESAENDSKAIQVITIYFHDLIKHKDLRISFKNDISIEEEAKQLKRIRKIIKHEKRAWQKHFSGIRHGLIKHIAKELAWKIAWWEVRQELKS